MDSHWNLVFFENQNSHLVIRHFIRIVVVVKSLFFYYIWKNMLYLPTPSPSSNTSPFYLPSLVTSTYLYVLWPNFFYRISILLCTNACIFCLVFKTAAEHQLKQFFFREEGNVTTTPHSYGKELLYYQAIKTSSFKGYPIHTQALTLGCFPFF